MRRGPLSALLVCLIAVAACSPDPTGSTAPLVTTARSPGPTTTTPTTGAATTSTSTVSTASPPAEGCEGFTPGPTLTRADVEVVRVVCVQRTADPPIAAVHERSTAAQQSAQAPPNFVELFTRGQQGWGLLADLSKIPVGRPLMGQPGQIAQHLIPLDFDGDGVDSLVVGVQIVGAAAGPLEITVLSFRGVDVAVDFQEGTQSGGRLSVDGRVLLLETGSYGPDEPRCCPSKILRQRIGWNPESKRVEVLEQTVTPLPTPGA